MISTLPPNEWAYISKVNPSGYCGASSSIRHIGKMIEIAKKIPPMINNIFVNGEIFTGCIVWCSKKREQLMLNQFCSLNLL
jgi:hypothetical protein